MTPEFPVTFGPQPPNDALLGAIAITCENEIVGVCCSCAASMGCDAVSTVYPSIIFLESAYCVFRLLLYTRNYRARTTFVSRNTT